MTTPEAGRPRPNLVRFLALEKNIVALLAMVVLVGLGEKMAERFLPLYLIALGGGALSVGMLNGMDNLLSALYSLPGGMISDRFGYKRALLIFNLIAMAGYLVVILLPYWQAVLAGAVLFVSWTAISLPATMDLVSTVLPKNKRTMGVSLHSFVRRIPMALGPVIGGALIVAMGETAGIRTAFIAALVLAGVSLLLQQTMITTRQPAGIGNRGVRGLVLLTPLLRRLLTPLLRRLLVSDILIRFCEQIPYAFVVIWCVSIHKITALQFGVLTTVEMVTAMLVYIPVAALADRSTKKPFVLITFVFFTLFPLVLLFARSFWVMVLAFILRGLKEFGEPTRKALIMDLAPEGRKAATFGVYYLVRDCIVSIAAFGGALLWDASAWETIAGWFGGSAPAGSIASPGLNLLVACGFGLLGTLYFAIFGRDLGKLPAVLPAPTLEENT